MVHACNALMEVIWVSIYSMWFELYWSLDAQVKMTHGFFGISINDNFWFIRYDHYQCNKPQELFLIGWSACPKSACPVDPFSVFIINQCGSILIFTSTEIQWRSGITWLNFLGKKCHWVLRHGLNAARKRTFINMFVTCQQIYSGVQSRDTPTKPTTAPPGVESDWYCISEYSISS